MEGIRAQGTEVKMPHLAESLVSATIERWLKQPGDYIAQFDVICELITEKVSAEMPSPIEGILEEIIVGNGETVDVGAVICIIKEPASSGQEKLGGVELTTEADQVQHTSSVASVSNEESTEGASDQSMRHRYSPVVLRLAAEHNIELSDVTGSGLGGRITRQDIVQLVEDRQSGKVNTPIVSESHITTQANVPDEKKLEAPLRTSGLHLFHDSAPTIEVEGQQESARRNEYFIDVTPIRNTIASRMKQSVTEIPHAWTMIEVDVTNLVTLRNKLKDDFIRQEGVNLTYLAFLLKAVVSALKDYPIMNSVWAVDKIIVKKDINISLVVGTEDAVYVPVIKKADQKNIAGLAREIDELTRKARSSKLSPDDVHGGTFTVNNTGSFGSVLSYPIINYPQAANFTFESIVKKPVVIQDMIAVRSMVNLCLSLDHRILDGVICGRFMQRVKENLEGFTPETKLY